MTVRFRLEPLLEANMRQTYCWWCKSGLTEKPKETCSSLEHLKSYIGILEESLDLYMPYEEEQNEED